MIYLDNAATTFPKPISVSYEMSKCINEYCGNPGRGAHTLARTASESIFDLRCKLSDMFSAPSPENVILTMNTTYAINIALKSVVKEGDHILISDLEHNSVLRCVYEISQSRGASYSVFNTFSGDSDKIIEDINRKIKKETKVLVCLHVSNISATVLPISKIGKLCRSKGIFFIADAAQSAGRYDINIKSSNINALCLPGHKGLYGPQGIGSVIFSNIEATSLSSVIEGGSGAFSTEREMPPFFPDRFEAGTLPTPNAVGMSCGIDFVLKNTTNEIRRHEFELSRKLYEKLANYNKVKIYSSPSAEGMVLFNIKGIPSVDVADILDKCGICVRAGLHCAPLAHRTLCTGDQGAVRVSFGAFNDMRDVEKTASAIFKIKSY